ncbi:unnamed protein product [Paramecium sonneborni]|uniref:Uncharacterized protein n=1 Tax=Paramecium sonneborni TaxID=65129 RepID=A0A8S1RLP5_9CILI|nr:unnamed protein product [Paramecium sonneborni]
MILESLKIDETILIGEHIVEEQNQSIDHQIKQYLNIINFSVSPNQQILSIFENKFQGQMINCPKNNKSKIKKLRIKIFNIEKWQIIYQGYLKSHAQINIYQKYSQDSNFLICYGGENIVIIDIKKQKEFVIDYIKQKLTLFTFDIRNNFYLQKDGIFIQLTLENDKWNEKQIFTYLTDVEIKYFQVLDPNYALIVKSQQQQIIFRNNQHVVHSRKVIIQSNKPEISIYNNIIVEMYVFVLKKYFIRQLRNGKMIRKVQVCDDRTQQIYQDANGLYHISTQRLQQNLYKLSSFDILRGQILNKRIQFASQYLEEFFIIQIYGNLIIMLSQFRKILRCFCVNTEKNNIKQ